MFPTGLTTFLGLSLIGPVAIVGVVALVLAVVAGGREPDATGQRQKAVYLGAVCFVTLFTMLFAGFAAVNSLANLVGEHEENLSVSVTGRTTLSSNGEFSSDDDSVQGTFTSSEDDDNTENAIAGAVLAGLFFVAAGAVFVWHRTRLEAMIADPDFPVGPARRAVQAYVYAVCFVAAVVAVFAGAVALYGIFRVLAPDITAPHGSHERDGGFREFLSAGALTAAAVVLFLQAIVRPDHWKERADALPPAEPPPPPPRRRRSSAADPGPVA